MYVCAWVCVFMFVCIHVSMCFYMCICVCVLICVYVCICLCMWVCVYVFVSAGVCVWVCIHKRPAATRFLWLLLSVGIDFTWTFRPTLGSSLFRNAGLLFTSVCLQF